MILVMLAVTLLVARNLTLIRKRNLIIRMITFPPPLPSCLSGTIASFACLVFKSLLVVLFYLHDFCSFFLPLCLRLCLRLSIDSRYAGTRWSLRKPDFRVNLGAQVAQLGNTALNSLRLETLSFNSIFARKCWTFFFNEAI